ncbi:MAG TPA: TadE family protein [Candidatus Binatia bacterium]|nr:TadE family protein [Candidatus Binatia bacterium]
MSCLRRRRAVGQTAVEFALVFPVFILLVMGCIDYGGYFGARLSVENAARAGARLAVIEQPSQSSFSGTAIVQAVTGQANDAPGLPSNSDCIWNGSNLSPLSYPPFTFSSSSIGCIGIWYFQLQMTGSPSLCAQWSVKNQAFGKYSSSGSTWTASSPNSCVGIGSDIVVVGVGYQYRPLTPVPYIGTVATNCPSGGGNSALCTYGETQLLEEQQ